MANSLKDLLNDALNISTGKSYKAEPARTVMRQASAPAQARTDNYVQNRPSQPARRRSFWSRAFDQVNPFDNNLTWKQETATQNKNLIQQAGQLGGQTARGITTVVPQAINSTAELGGDTVDLARAGVAQATGNWKARDAALNRGLQSKYSNPGQGLLGTGGLIDNQTASKPIPTSKLVKTIAGKGVQGAAEIGSAVTGGFAGKELVNQGFKQGFQSQVPNLVKSSVLNAAQGGADTFNRGGNSRDVVKAAATSALLGTAADVGLGVAGAATSKLVRAGVDNLPTKPVFADFNGKVPNDPLEALKAEARKYKSADEFTQAIQDGKVSIPKGSPEQIAAIQKQLGMNWDEAYKTPTGVYDMQKKVANDLYNQATAPQVGKTPNYLDTNTSQQVLNKTIQPKSELWSRWFKQSDYKALPEIEQDILKNPQIKDAGTSRMYDYYKEMFGENMTYDEFLNKDITLYRGGNTRATNNMASYSLLERKAKRFGDVSSITVKPKDTYGMLGDFSEGEVFVPSKSTPPAQVGKTDPLEALKAEARKYKSAEEFVKAQGEPLYHGTRDTFDTFDLEKTGQGGFSNHAPGINMTTSKKGASEYANYKRDYLSDNFVRDDAGIVMERWIKPKNTLDTVANPNLKIKDVISQEQFSQMIKQAPDQGRLRKMLENRVYGDDAKSLSDKELIKRLYKQHMDSSVIGDGSYSGISKLFSDLSFPYMSSKSSMVNNFRKITGIDSMAFPMKNGADKVVVSFDPNNLLSKQQLTDLYNQATAPQVGKTDPKTIRNNWLKEQASIEKSNPLPENWKPAPNDVSKENMIQAIQRKLEDAIPPEMTRAGNRPKHSELRITAQKMYDDAVRKAGVEPKRTVLNGNEPKLNGVERKITETEPKITESTPVAQVGKTDPMQQVFDANPVNEQATRLQRQSIDQPVKDTSYLSRMTNEDAARPAEFNAVAATAGSKSAKKLEQELVSNAKVTEKLKEAQLSGEEVNFYAKKDKNGRSVGIEEFDPTKHRIESGFVIDNNGKVLGNHVKVDSTGVQVNVGGDLVNMDAVVGNPTDWQGSYRMMETMDRNIKRNAPDEATYRRTREFLIDHKIKNEANFKEELRSQRQNLGQQAKDVQSVRPSNVSKDEFNSDIFDFIEGKTGSGDIKAKYGNGAQAIIDYKNSTRQLYDNLLDRVNEVFAKYGEAPVSKRKDYITHINELMNKPSFAGELFGQLQNTMLGEGMQTTRKSVPGSIAGRTETFEPRKRWNRFFQARKGGEFTKDPFKAVDAYLEPTLYNIHMTESAVRARAVETAFRTADEIRNMDKQRFTQALTEDFEKYRNGDNSKLITGFQEYANALAGKTQRFDRQIIDASKGTEMGLRGWQGLQRVGGRGTVLGNAQSVLSQTLNQPLTLADAGVKNYLKGVASSLTGNTPIDKSPFIRARATKVDSPFKGVGQKALDVGGVPLEQVELAMVKTTWNAEYHKAVEKGFKGQKAIMEADRATEQVVAGRGIADKPEAYRSTAANGFLQYTLEVAATNKKFWQDLSPTQKATYVAAVFGANSVFGLVTGYEPLPDFLGATVDTAQDFADPNDKRSAAQKAVGGAQRYASAGVEMNPLATAGVNTFLNKDQRQAIFGKDSSLGRFEGTAAPVQVVRNTVDAASKLTKKQYGAAASSAIKNAPYGNQVNKTATSAAMLARGYATDAKGNPTYAAPTSPIGKVQSLLFGPNSTKNAQNYYNNNQRPITGKSDLAAIKDSGNKQSTVAELQKTKLENRTKGDTSYDELKNTLQNTFGGKFRDKSEQELRDLSKTDADAKTYYSQLQGLKNINNTPDLPDGIDAKARNVLTKRSRLAQEGKVKWGLKKADDKEITNTIHSWLPQTAEKPQITNDIAVKWAELEKKRASGTLGKLEEESQKKTILRDAYNSSLSEDEKDLYKLSKAKLSDALNNGLISEDNIKKALEVEKKLFDAGLIGKETLASKLGVSARGYKGKSSGKKGKSGKGRKGSTKGKYDYKLFAFNSKPSNTQKSLRELVKKATL